MQFLSHEKLIDSTIPNLSNNYFATNLSQYTTNFTSLHTIVTENKPYTPITTCVLQHILTTTNLCDLEKLFYILADNLSLINHNKGKKRSVTISARQWAEKLDCSIAEIFSMQQSLEQKGYFEIYRSKNKNGKNKKNTITPTLPDSIFNSLVKTPNRFNIGTYSTDTSLYSNFSTAYLPNLENKRTYLDRTKMFIKLNYDLLLLITSSSYLTKFAKVLWLDFYSIGYRYYLKHRDCDNNTTNNKQYHAKNTEELDEMLMYTSDNIKTDDYVNYVAPPNSYYLTTTYKELQDKYSCSKPIISKTLKELETLGFITRQRFFVKNDDEDDNLHDKSVWRITVTLPNMIQQHLQNEVKDRSKTASRSVVSNYDPYVSNSSQYINKYFISNTKDLDNIDSEKSFFAKNNIYSSENLSELSISYKNSLEEEQKETLLEKEQEIVSINTTLPIINIQESLLEVGTCKETPINVPKDKLESTKKVEEEQEGTIEEIKEISEIVKEEQEKTLPLNQLREQSDESDEKEQINCGIGNGLVNTTSEISVATASIVHHKKSSNQNKALVDQRSTTEFHGKSLKSFYPLTKEEVDKLNQLSSREFSNNFANQLLLKLYIRDPNKTFASTNHMISYMSKAFRYEKHQAPLVNHETFRFTANVSDHELEMQQKEKYLTEVEYSIDTSYSSQLRKKIAGMFETKLAYQILTEGKFDYHATKYQTTSQELEITNDAWQNLELSEENNITQFEHVLDDHSTCYVDSSLNLDSKHDVDYIDYDNQLSTNVTEENDQIKTSLVMTENDDINYDINDKILTRELSELSLKSLSTRQFARITLANTCTIKLPRDLTLTNNQQQNLENAIVAVYGYVKIVYQQLPATYKKLGSSRLPDEIFLTELDTNSVWYKIRKKLIANFDEHIDKAWFSKLRAEEDGITHKLTLIAPTNFLKDWINHKYGSVIKDIAKTLDYQFVELITSRSAKTLQAL
ncbi:MAG: DnaA N-terminal domain-containing protein [Candidatus Tisiphia sp.]